MLKKPTKPARRPRSSAYGVATTIDEYLARVEARAARRAGGIATGDPEGRAEGRRGHHLRIPAFRQNGFLIGFAASARHCSLHPMNSHTVADFATELAGYSTSTGTIRFTPEKPLPAALVRKIVKARITENDADAKEKLAMKGRRNV